MATLEPEWASRFYGMRVGPEIAALADEHLTDPTIEDLVDAHLAINRPYFGAIDKTLAGFVVLDSAGDDYTLFDLRDGGQVWWQDHETRALELRHDSLADHVGHRDAPAETPRLSPRGTRAVSTPALAARYQWLVWLFGRPIEHHGAAVQSADYLVRNGIGRLRHIWPRRDTLEAAFERELGELRGDPHLAIYWLLHATAFADAERRRRVVEAMGPVIEVELPRAFVARLGELPAAGELAVVPEFRARRALAQTYGEIELVADDVPRACLTALELEPWTSSLVHALQVTSGLERGLLDPAIVAATLARIPERTPGTELVRAVLAKRAGATASDHADALAGAMAPLIARGDEPWWFALEALWQTHELAYDAAALVEATRALVARDRFHRRALQMAMRAAQIASLSEVTIDAIEHDLEIADRVVAPFQLLVEHPRDWRPTVAALAGDLEATRALATRVLQRAPLNRPSGELAAWAALQIVDDPFAVVLIGNIFHAMDGGSQAEVIAAIASELDGPGHPLVEVVLRCIDAPEPDTTDFAAQLQMKRAKGAALVALAPWFASPALFDRLIALVERPASGAVVDLVWSKLFSLSDRTSYVVPRLDRGQAVRVARALVASELRHPSIHARNAAGHALYRFSHPGAEAFLIDALTEYGVRFAAARGPGGVVLDHGKTEHDQLEDVVANLYAAVRGLGTPGSREALIERLFAERRAYWRLGSAIGDVWSPELHARVLELLVERRDARAAGTYAYALHDFVKKGQPLVELLRLVREWQGDTELARGFLHYALVVGIDAALAARDYDLVRLAHESAAWIAEPPLEPDAHARGRTWSNPLETEDGTRALAAALSGEAAAERAALVAAAAAARVAGIPNVAITDDALGQLANAQVSSRLLHDRSTGEVWFRDREGVIHVFDGYAIATADAAPFAARAIDFDGAAYELAGATAISERALWWGPEAQEFRDAVRIGRHVLVAWGLNNGSFERYVLAFRDEAGAAAGVARLRANPAPGFEESEAYYLPGRGAIVRTYHVREDGAEPQRKTLSVVDGVLEGAGDLGSEAAAIAEHVRREVAWLATGAVMTRLEWADNRRRRTDLTVREWIAGRVRSDGRSAAWHVEALAEIARYLADHGYPVPLEVQLGSPATPADIAAFAAARARPVPEALDTLWRTLGAASWRLGERGMRLLAPLEVLARRPVARAAADAYLAKLAPAAARQAAPMLGSLDVLVETLDARPATFVADVEHADGRVFTHAYDHVSDFWWEKSLGWMLATGLLGDLEDAIATAAPSVERLRYGQPARAALRPARPRAATKVEISARAASARARVAALRPCARRRSPRARPPRARPHAP